MLCVKWCDKIVVEAIKKSNDPQVQIFNRKNSMVCIEAELCV